MVYTTCGVHMPNRPARYRPTPKRPTPSEASRPTAAQRGYGWRWQQFRLSFLAEHPLCERCKPRVVEATVVDHVTPHKGDAAAFWAGPFCALCDSCHSRKTATEDGGFGREPKSKE
jgi:5-methylcytosine-specific restriction enzyme A